MTCRYLLAAALALFVFVIYFAKQLHFGLSLADEGFLWYGAKRVLGGEVPILDFRAYDPGRYLWASYWMKLLGNSGILALRFSSGVLLAVAVVIGALLVVHPKRKYSLLFSVFAALTLILWMYWPHKAVDYAMPIILLTSLTLILGKPSAKNFFWGGVTLGLISFFGRNHALYGAFAGVLTILYIVYRREYSSFKRALFFGFIGILVGCVPLFLMLVFVPDFAGAYWESILYHFEVKTTNLPLPVPWPWTFDFAQLSFYDSLRRIVYGSFFIGLIVFPIVGIIFIITNSKRLQRDHVENLVISSTFLSIPYAHYTFSRADIPHLSFGAIPLVIGLIAYFQTKKKEIVGVLLSLVLLAATFLVIYPFTFQQRAKNEGNWTEVTLGDDSVIAPPIVGSELWLLNTLVDRYAPNGRPFLAIPFWPGASAVFERKSPTWEIYFILPASKKFQEKEIEWINKAEPGFVIIYDGGMDGRDDLKFMNTHPLIDQYIRKEFIPVRIPRVRPIYRIYRNKDTNP